MDKALGEVRVRARAWIVFIAVGAVLAAVCFAVPLSRNAAAVLDVLFPLANLIAILAGIYLYRPARPRPWVLFAVGMICFLGQNVSRSIQVLFVDGPLLDVPLQDLFQTAGYLLIITALLTLIYSRNGGARDRASLIDASIIIVGAGMLAWVFVLAPFFHDDSIPISARLFKMLYPVANFVLLAVSVRLAISRGAHTPAFAMLLLAMTASLIGNMMSLSAIEDRGFMLPDNPVNLAFFVVYTLAGAAPLHPSMRTLTEVSALESRITWTRIVLFLFASTTGVAAYFIEVARGRHVDVPVILLGSLVVFVLVLLRLAGLNRDMLRSEQRFRSLIQNASDAFAILEPDGTFRYVSPASESIVGVPSESLVGTNCLDLVLPEDLPRALEYLENALVTQGDVGEILVRGKHKDGSSRWIEVSGTNLLHDPAVNGMIANFHDVTDTKEAEEALRASEQNSRLLFGSSPLPMWLFDNETLRFLDVNDATVAHYGYSREELLSMTIMDLRPEEERPRLREVLEKLPQAHEAQTIVHSGEWTHETKTGNIIVVEIASHALVFGGRPATLVAAQDITERKRVEAEKETLERQLHQSQRLEAVGQLAGGVAHDFNNLLAVILNYGRFVRDDVDPESETYEDATQVLNAADKAARLVRQLLAFSRREIVKPEVIDVNGIVEEIHRLLRRTTKESINLQLELGEDLWRTVVDPGQMEQVLLNLAVNADAAMPGGGTLAVKTWNMSLSPEDASQRAELVPGDYVCVSVSDDGIGMSEDIAAHIFEPFFTTKGIGEGTGLGLSTVYGIVKQAGGYIYADSEEGRGTTFTIFLPATDADAGERTKSPDEHHDDVGSGSILVVEDEDGVRAIAERILVQAGYDVTVAPDAMTAIKAVADGKNIDVLLTDVIMPGLSGRELSRRLGSKRPGLRTIFMSGYTDDIIATHGVLEPGVTFLQKPFGPDELLPLVREALRGGGPAAEGVLGAEPAR